MRLGNGYMVLGTVARLGLTPIIFTLRDPLL